MPEHLLVVVVINAGILLLASWAVFAFFLGKARAIQRRLRKKLLNQSELVAQLKEDLRKVTRDARTKGNNLKGEASLVGDMADALDSNQQALAELSSLQRAQEALLAELDQLPEAMQENKALKSAISSLKAQANNTDSVLTDLNSDLDNSRYRLRTLEEKLQRQSDELKRVNGLENLEKRTRQRNDKLMEKVQEQAKRLGEYKALERKASDLGHMNRRLQLEAKTSNAKITQLQQQIEQAQSGQPPVPEDHAVLKVELSEAQNTARELQLQFADLQDDLQRAVREKEFIEAQFLEAIDVIDRAEDVEFELEKSRKEYSMLEKHFMRLTGQEAPKQKKNHSELGGVEAISPESANSDSVNKEPNK